MKSATRRILVVDDDPHLVRTTASLLTLMGHDVIVAGSGPEALAKARFDRPHAVLLDIGLPGMDGYEVASRLRAQAGLTETIIIAVSGYSGEDDLKKCAESGIDHHLVKPINIQELDRLLSAG